MKKDIQGRSRFLRRFHASRTFILVVSLILMPSLETEVQAKKPTTMQIQEFIERKLPERAMFVRGEVIVKMKPGKSIKAADFSSLSLVPDPRRTSENIAVYRVNPSIAKALGREKLREQTLGLVQALRKRSDVEYAQPNYRFRLADVTPNDPHFGKQWHFFNNGAGTGESPGGIGLPKSWTLRGSNSVVVAVLDTGIAASHEDITGANLVAGYDMVTDWWGANDNDPPDPSLSSRDNIPTDPGDMATECEEEATRTLYNTWHGTHVAGIVGVGDTDNNKGIAGVNWQVKVLPVRVSGRCGPDSWDVQDGILWAAGLTVTGIPNNATPAQVINLSFAMRMPCSGEEFDNRIIRDAIATVVAQGVVVVAAAGNGDLGEDVAGFLPASCDNVIAVAASDHNGQLASYSNFGSRIDIMAPGGALSSSTDINGVYSLIDMVDGGYGYNEGTSMAAPHVAGVAALWLARAPTLTPAQLLINIRADALVRTSSQCPNPCGAGLLQAPKPPVRPPSPFGPAVLIAAIVIAILIAMWIILRLGKPKPPIPPEGAGSGARYDR